MDATMPVMEQVHTLADKLQPVLAGQRGKIQRMAKLRYCRQRSPTQCLTQVLVQLCLGLFRVIVQDCQAFGIGGNLQSQGFLYRQSFFSQRSGKDGSDIVALACPLTSGNAEQIVLRSQRNAIHSHDRFGNVRWILIVNFTGT